MPKLTKRTVEGLPKKERDYITFDSDLPGFGVRVMASGKRFFLIQYRTPQGRQRRVSLGQFGPTTAEVARNQALRLLGQIKGAGADPAAERELELKAQSVTELGERFLKEYVSVRCKPSTRLEYTRCVRLFIQPHFKSQRVRTVSTADVADFHSALSHIPYQGNRALGVLSKMMSLAETWGMRPKRSNPCEDIERYAEIKRERFLSQPEISALGEALAAYEALNAESYFAALAFRLLLLTGCRLGEIQTLQWSFVRLDEFEFRLPDSKTGAKTVYIGEAVVALLRVAPRLRDNPYVIAGKLPETHLTDLQRPWRKIREAAGLEDVRIHDLRHTFASGALTVGEGLPMIGKLLGHTQVQTTARYAHLASAPVKAAASKIADRLATALLKPGHQSAQAPPSPDISAEIKAIVAGEVAAFRGAMRLIVEDPDLNGGQASFRGTRLVVMSIADLLQDGCPLAELQIDYPRLTMEMAEAALVYARNIAA